MRLIDATAEIAKINKEIKKYEARIIHLQNKRNEEPDNNYNDWDEKIKQCERNIFDCKKEIKRLRSYSIAYDVVKVMAKLEDVRSNILNSSDYENDVINYILDIIDNAIEIVEAGGVDD